MMKWEYFLSVQGINKWMTSQSSSVALLFYVPTFGMMHLRFLPVVILIHVIVVPKSTELKKTSFIVGRGREDVIKRNKSRKKFVLKTFYSRN